MVRGIRPPLMLAHYKKPTLVSSKGHGTFSFMPTSRNSKTVFLPMARSRLSMFKASASRSSRRESANFSSLLGMLELRNDWNMVAMMGGEGRFSAPPSLSCRGLDRLVLGLLDIRQLSMPDFDTKRWKRTVGDSSGTLVKRFTENTGRCGLRRA